MTPDTLISWVGDQRFACCVPRLPTPAARLGIALAVFDHDSDELLVTRDTHTVFVFRLIERCGDDAAAGQLFRALLVSSGSNFVTLCWITGFLPEGGSPEPPNNDMKP